MSNNLHFEIVTLQNGTTIILCPISTVQSLYIRVDLKNGAIFEDEKNSGVSHVLEHYLHQGSKEYPKAQQFTLELEKEGMFENAATYLFGSYYWIKSPIFKTQKTIEMLFSMLSNPLLPEERLNHVREVVMQEYYDHWQHPQSTFYRDLHKKRFVDETVFLNDTLGLKEVVETLTVPTIRSWFERFYQPQNMLITLAGNIQKNEVLPFLEKTFGTLKKGKPIEFPKVKPGGYSNFLIHHHQDPREQITFSLSFPAFGWDERTRHDEQVLNFLARLMASSRFSRLYHILREENNLVYGVSAHAALYPTRGTLSINGSTSTANLVKTFTILKKELMRIKKDGFSEEEMRIAKNIYESGLIFDQETPEAIAGFIENQQFWNLEILTPQEQLAGVHTTTEKEVHTIAKEVLDFKKLNIGLFGNMQEKDIETIRALFS